jgi:uncharacterized protein YkwD
VNKKTNPKLQHWMIAGLLIIALTAIGFGISMLVGTYIPFWLLLIFSLIFSIEKWFTYHTRKHKYLGKIYRLLLNLSFLSMLGLIIWSGVKLFSQELLKNSLIGSLLFIAELGFFIWIFRVVFKNSWRWPSMKLTVFSVVCLFVIFAFAGVKPMSSIKDDAFIRWDTYWEEQKVKTEERLAQAETEQQIRIEEQKVAEQKRIAEQEAEEAQAKVEQETALQTKVSEIEHEVVLLVNLVRADKSISMLMWDDTLYEYSKTHSIDMAEKRELFHSPVGLAYAENAWGGEGSRSWGADDIVQGWLESPKHRTWLLCPNLKHVAVGIAYSNNGMYASWTFWVDETVEADWWYQYTPDNPPKWWY